MHLVLSHLWQANSLLNINLPICSSMINLLIKWANVFCFSLLKNVMAYPDPFSEPFHIQHPFLDLLVFSSRSLIVGGFLIGLLLLHLKHPFVLPHFKLFAVISLSNPQSHLHIHIAWPLESFLLTLQRTFHFQNLFPAMFSGFIY